MYAWPPQGQHLLPVPAHVRAAVQPRGRQQNGGQSAPLSSPPPVFQFQLGVYLSLRFDSFAAFSFSVRVARALQTASLVLLAMSTTLLAPMDTPLNQASAIVRNSCLPAFGCVCRVVPVLFCRYVCNLLTRRGVGSVYLAWAYFPSRSALPYGSSQMCCVLPCVCVCVFAGHVDDRVRAAGLLHRRDLAAPIDQRPWRKRQGVQQRYPNPKPRFLCSLQSACWSWH